MTCNRVAIINRGQIVATNRPEILMTQLVGGSGYELEIDGDAKEVEKLLQILPGVCMVEVVEDPDLPPQRTLLRIISSPGAEPGRDIAAVTMSVGCGIHELRRTRATLEDVFLQLTTQEQPITESDYDLEGSDEDAVTSTGAQE